MCGGMFFVFTEGRSDLPREAIGPIIASRWSQYKNF